MRANAGFAQIMSCYRVLDMLERQRAAVDAIGDAIADRVTAVQRASGRTPSIDGLWTAATAAAAPRPTAAAPRSPQLGGELLDLLARLFELLERRRIGDAEVRALAEGGSVHDGDAFRVQKLGDEVLIGFDHLA